MKSPWLFLDKTKYPDGTVDDTWRNPTNEDDPWFCHEGIVREYPGMNWEKIEGLRLEVTTEDDGVMAGWTEFTLARDRDALWTVRRAVGGVEHDLHEAVIFFALDALGLGAFEFEQEDVPERWRIWVRWEVR